MPREHIELQLKDDQVFGLHACVPEAEIEWLCEALTDVGVKFGRDWPQTGRLDEPGRRTLVFFDPIEELREAFVSADSSVQFAPAVVTLSRRYDAPFAALLETGRPASGVPDATAVGFGPGHVAGLIRVLSDPELHAASSEHDVIWAPIHALRILGGLRAELAIDPMLAQLHRIDDENDDWLGDEVSSALAEIGPAAVVPATAYLADESRGPYARLAAARALASIGRKWPQARAAGVEALVLQLGAHMVQAPDFNGLLVSTLLDVPAPEAAPAIERAFASGRVDETIAGDWEDVQIEFGFKRARERPRKPDKWPALGAQLRETFGLPEPDGLSGPLESLLTPGTPYRAAPKVGRNDPCPCGSGKKFKKCCGA